MDGYVSLELGDTAELSVNTDGTEPATWTIEKIEVDPAACDGPRDSGHLLLLFVRADSGPDNDAAEQIPAAFRAESFAEPGELTCGGGQTARRQAAAVIAARTFVCVGTADVTPRALKQR